MSLFRNERLSIALCPEQVAVLKSSRGRQAARSEPLVLDVSTEPDSPLWKNGVTALMEGLSAERIPAALVLSNRFVRFALLPWAASAQGEGAAQALALACLESQYGGMSGWSIRIDDGVYGAPRLACAIESALLDALRAVFDAQRIPCPRVEPYFITCWNRWHKEINHSEALFVVSESGTTVIASIKAGCWHSVRMLGGAHDRDTLAGFIARESLLQGFSEPPVCWLHAPTLDAESFADVSGKINVMNLDRGDLVGKAGAARVMAAVGAAA